ncbi:MAG: beta-N-acetylhexosaminidase [Victivallales bacterium]|nr:beta-N-acetylhexosaminidase [Victivallales bacterium]
MVEIMKILALMLSGSVILPLSGMNIDNFRSQDGFPLIIPAVQKCQKTNESFSLPATLSVSAPDSLKLQLLEKTFSERFGGKLVRSKDGNVRFILTGKEVPANDEGYTLAINKNGITVSARKINGLFYGMQTLRWMIRNAEDKTLPGCRIEDFPDLKMRGVLLELNYLHPDKVDKLCEAIGIFALLKYNTFLTDFGDNFPLKDNPYTKRKFTLSVSDIQKIKKACEDNHVEIIPYIQAVSHAMWMTRHPEFETKISEGKPVRPWNSAYCLSKPLPAKLMKDYLAEVIALLKPRYFDINLDEVDRCPFRVCPECKKHDPVELFGNHVKMLQDFMLERGVIPMVAHDQFDCVNPFVNSKVREVLKKLDRRTVIIIWDYKVYPNEKPYEYFNSLGFPTVYMSFTAALENTRNLPCLAAKQGNLGCILTYWCSLPATFEWRLSSRVSSYAGTIYGASTAWNASGKRLNQCSYDSIFEMKRLIEPKKVVDYENSQGVEIPLNRVVNARLGQNPFFPLLDAAGISELKRELASGKERFHLVTDRSNYFGIVLSGGEKDSFPADSAEIPVGRTAKGFSFLMTAAPFNDFLLRANAKPWIGELKVNYENRKSVSIRIYYRITLNTWNAQCGGYNMRIVNRGTDLRGAAYNFYAFDWKNPFPSAKVKSISFSSKKQSGIMPGLFAISALSAGTGGEAAMTDAEIVKLVPAAETAREEPKLYPLVDFDPKNPRNLDCNGTTWGRFIFRPKFKVTDTPPDAPFKGKMLAITVPPLKEDKAWGRVVVDIPIEAHKNFETVLFAVRCSNPEWIWRSDTYLRNLGKQTGKANVLFGFGTMIPMDNGFYTFAIPRAAFRGRERGGVDVSGRMALRIGFFVKNRGAMTIDLDQVFLSPDKLPWIREFRTKAVK